MGCNSSHNAAVQAARLALTATVPNAEEIHIVINKGDGIELGARTKPNVQGEAVIFNIFDGGMLRFWNREQPPQKRVKVGDRITSVNGVSQNFWPMMFELRSKGTHYIVLSRGSLEHFEAAGAAEKTPQTLSNSVLNDLPRVLASECEDVECSICLADFEELTPVLKLPCGHGFHVECAERWLTTCKATCPMCCAPADQSSGVKPQHCESKSSSSSSVSEPGTPPVVPHSGGTFVGDTLSTFMRIQAPNHAPHGDPFGGDLEYDLVPIQTTCASTSTGDFVIDETRLSMRPGTTIVTL